MVKQLHIQWQQVKGFPHASVRRIEFCCPAMAENWNRITQFVRHRSTQQFEVVNRTELSAANLQAAAEAHVAAVAVDEGLSLDAGNFDLEGVPDYSRVFPCKYCPHCGAEIVIEKIDDDVHKE